MSVHVSSRAWKTQGLSFAEKLVLLKLADMANDEGVCWPSNATIGRECGLDARSVRRITARLEARGLLTRKAQYRKGGLQGTNWLVVLPPDDRKAAGEDSTVLPAGEDSPVLPGGTARSSLGGTARSSKPSIETSKKRARVENVRPAGRSASHRNDAARPASSPKRDGGPGGCAAVGGAGVGSAAEAVALLARMGSYETSLLLQGRDSFLAGQPIKAASPLFEALRQAARAQDAEKRGAA